VKEVLDEVVDILPSPLDVKPAVGTSPNGGRRSRDQDRPAGPVAAMAFKTLSEQHLGDLSLLRIYSGRIRAGQGRLQHDAPAPREDRFALYDRRQGAERMPRRRGRDIVAAVKLKENTYRRYAPEKAHPVLLPPPIPGLGHCRVHPREEQGRREKWRRA